MRLNEYSAVLNVILFILFQQAVDAKNCDRPTIANGQAKLRGKGKMVSYICRANFTRFGAKFAVCLSQGAWSQPPPICIGTGCPAVTPTNGLQIIGEYNDTMLKFTCPAGMKRKGPESIYCNGQTWNVEPPTCIVGISLQCDFEDEALCGWSQSNDDHFEWSWLSGATPTANTGPLHDHTFGNNSKEGHYLFIESSAPRKPFDKAILKSPPYQAQHSGICFEFWYHMQGPDDENAVGSLEVFVKPESKLLDDIDPEFYMDGNQGPEWKRGLIRIKQQTEVFQIIIIATRKEAFVSDIAIDDVRMYNCSKDDHAFLTAGKVTSEAVPTTQVTKSSTTTPKTKRTITLPTTTTALTITTTTLPATTITVPTTTTAMPTTTTAMPTAITTAIPKTIKQTINQDTMTTTRSTTTKASTTQRETPTITTAKEKTTFTNLFFTGNSHNLSEKGSGNIGGDNNISSTSNESHNIALGSSIKAKTKDSLMPLIIGVSCGVALGFVVIGAAVYLWAKRQQNKTTGNMEEEITPMTCAEGGYYNP